MVHNFQSIGSIPFFIRYSLVFEKCLQPKNPLSAEKGEGCAAFKTKCLVSSIRDLFFLRKFSPKQKYEIVFQVGKLLDHRDL